MSGSQTITIDFKFAKEYPDASCVLVYREYGHSLLTVIEFNQQTYLPVTITVDKPENNTFALFGKSELGMEEEPMLVVKFSAPKKTVSGINLLSSKTT